MGYEVSEGGITVRRIFEEDFREKVGFDLALSKGRTQEDWMEAGSCKSVQRSVSRTLSPDENNIVCFRI